MTNWNEETIKIARERADVLREQFIDEVMHLLKSGALDDEKYSRGTLFGVALENIANRYLIGEKTSKTYKNLCRF